MEFGPAKFPAVIDSPMQCRWFVVGPTDGTKTAIEFLYADVPSNKSCDTAARTGNCLTVVQASRSDTVLSNSSQIQEIPLVKWSAIVALYVYEPLSFRGFHARFIEIQ